METLCKNNHRARKETRGGITRCTECIRAQRERQNEAKRAARRAAPPPDPKNVEAWRAALVARNVARGEAARAEKAAARSDGWEDEYGPCPDPVPNSEWFDVVIVDRVITKTPPGRAPYPLEWIEIFRRATRAQISDAELADTCGVSVGWIRMARGQYCE